MSTAAALAELERSPALPDHVARLQNLLADERIRREQFRRDYEGKRGEFINGQIYVSPSARLDDIDASAHTLSLLHTFVNQRGLGAVFGGKCLVQCQRNDYEPDVCFFGPAKAAAFTPATSLFPPPDLAVEILAPATIEHDRKLKFHDYARHGVGEYWLVDAAERLVEQYFLPPGAESYLLKARLPDGARLTSIALPDFRAPVAAFFDAGEYQQALRDLASL